ncbi:MAG: methylated-DNA--[protein]-cysteine S-methyltransferase [Desulfobacterales bacterium]
MSETLLNSFANTPLGKMLIIASEKGLSFLEFNGPNRADYLNRRLKRYFYPFRVVPGRNKHSDLACRWLEHYFTHRRDPYIRIHLDVRGTDFELRVWHEMQRIPFGKTTGYGEIAANIEMPKGSRAVGGACGRNPVSIIIPCHRVIGGNGTLTGYGGGLAKKSFLLGHEAVS